MRALLDVIRWKRIPISAGAAAGNIELTIGEVGAGHPVGLVAAGIHGDEGPWGAWAIRKLLETTAIDDLRGSLRVLPAANPRWRPIHNAPLDSLDLNRTFPEMPAGRIQKGWLPAVSNAVEGLTSLLTFTAVEAGASMPSPFSSRAVKTSRERSPRRFSRPGPTAMSRSRVMPARRVRE
jgi:hypothetical protein